MLEEILAAISLGHRVLNAVSAFRKPAASVRSEAARTSASFAQIDALNALDERTSNLEIIAKEQSDRMTAIERLLKESLVATEAIAHRIAVILWIATAGSVAALIGIILAVIALARTAH